MRSTKTNQGRLKKDSNFKVLVCLLAPGPFFFCVFNFFSEAMEPGNFLV